MNTTETLLQAGQVSRLTGASIRQILYWDQHGWLRTGRRSRQPAHRRFGLRSLRRAALMASISSMRRSDRGRGGRKFSNVAMVSDRQIEKRFLLFTPKYRLLAASDDAAEVIAIAAASAGVRLVDLGNAIESEKP